MRRYDARRLRAVFRRAGLRVVHASRYNVLLAAPMALVRWLGDHWTRTPPNGSDVGRPIPDLAKHVLDMLWRCEADLAERINLHVGLTHVAVLAIAPDRA